MKDAAPLYGPRVVATGVTLLALCGVLVIAMFRTTLGPFEFRGGFRAAPTWRVALWTEGDDAARHRSARRWEERLEGRFELEAPARIDLEHLEPQTVDLLVVDGVVLAPREAAALRGFVERGGRLALFGPREEAPGADPVALSGLLGRSLRPARNYRWSLLPAASGPIGAGFSTVSRLPLRRAHGVYALPEAEIAAPEVVWAAAPGYAGAQSAAWRGEVGAGRMVWWSVRPDFALDRVDAQATMTRMVRASVAWLLEEPFAQRVTSGEVDPARVERVDVRITQRSGNRFLLSLTNRGDAASTDLRLRVFLNRKVAGVDVERTASTVGRGGIGRPVFALAADRGELMLRTPGLGPGESRSYYLDLSEAQE